LTERIVVVSDTQIPYDDRSALKAVVGFIGDFQPDRVIHIGDLMDFPTPARWSKGTAEEFAKEVKRDIEHAKSRFLDPLRKVFDGPIGVHEGNHDLRPRQYLAKYAPALVEFEDQFHIKELLDFNGFGIDLLEDFHKIAPGWVTTHGHLGKIRLTQTAGSTALGAARRANKSVVMGHTHRLGISSYTMGFEANYEKVVTGFEVGNLMNMKLASYLGGGTGNWQQGFGLMTIDKNLVQPQPVNIFAGKFVVDGRVWKIS
jgi:predicted phosphodiesterase